jgi:Cupredoxin-like domain
VVRNQRPAVSRTVWIILIIIVIAVIAIGESELHIGSAPPGTTQIDLRIIEDNPVLQEDHFYPDSLYLPLNQNISLAVQNGDDEQRVFSLPQFNINLTISPGETQRVNFDANKLGTSNFTSPITPPSIASAGRQGPCLRGFFTVTQNTTLLTTTTATGSGISPTAAQAAAAANGTVGSCNSSTALTVP